MNYKELLHSVIHDPVLNASQPFEKDGLLKINLEINKIDSIEHLKIRVEPYSKNAGDMIIIKEFASNDKITEEFENNCYKHIVFELLLRGVMTLHHTHSGPFLKTDNSPKRLFKVTVADITEYVVAESSEVAIAKVTEIAKQHDSQMKELWEKIEKTPYKRLSLRLRCFEDLGTVILT